MTAFASLYGNLLGFSRISFAAARDGAFLPIFGRLHPRKDFPHVALLAVGALSLIASLFTLDQVIAFLTAGIVLIQGIAQIVALGVLRARRASGPFTHAALSASGARCARRLGVGVRCHRRTARSRLELVG